MMLITVVHVQIQRYTLSKLKYKSEIFVRVPQYNRAEECKAKEDAKVCHANLTSYPSLN